MPIYNSKKIDVEKIKEIIRAHPHNVFEIGFKEDWDNLHVRLDIKNINYDIPDNIEGIDESWWDTPVLRIYDSNNYMLSEIEVWKQSTFETSEENYNFHKEALEEMKKRHK